MMLRLKAVTFWVFLIALTCGLRAAAPCLDDEDVDTGGGMVPSSAVVARRGECPCDVLPPEDPTLEHYLDLSPALRIFLNAQSQADNVWSKQLDAAMLAELEKHDELTNKIREVEIWEADLRLFMPLVERCLFQRLAKLSLTSCDLTADDIRSLANLPKLTKFSLPYCISCYGSLSDLPSTLEELSFECSVGLSTFPDQALSLPNLKLLNLKGTRVSKQEGEFRNVSGDIVTVLWNGFGAA